MEPIAVTDGDELAALCRRWRQQAAVALDTEFVRTNTFFPIAGLIQVGDGGGCYLVDPLAIEDLSPLADLLRDDKVTKVLHACSEDLEVLQRLMGVLPAPLFDTQLAAAFCGYGFSLSYAALARETLGIDIPKGETRSDWLQRPLSLAQQKYAALDVAHLLIIYGKLLQRLKAEERLHWVREDCAELVVQASREADPNEYYRKVGSAWKLQRRELAVLRALCRWREEQARVRNLPRNRLVKEAVLWELASRVPTSADALAKVPGIAHRTLEEDGQALLALVTDTLASDPAQWPELLPPPLTRDQCDVLKQLKNYVRGRAQSLRLPPELLARKKDYEFIVRALIEGRELLLPARLASGWRHELVGERLAQRAAQIVSNTEAGEQHQ